MLSSWAGKRRRLGKGHHSKHEHPILSTIHLCLSLPLATLSHNPFFFYYNHKYTEDLGRAVGDMRRRMEAMDETLKEAYEQVGLSAAHAGTIPLPRSLGLF